MAEVLAQYIRVSECPVLGQAWPIKPIFFARSGSTSSYTYIPFADLHVSKASVVSSRAIVPPTIRSSQQESRGETTSNPTREHSNI